MLSDFVSQTFDPVKGQITLQIYTSVQTPYTLTLLSSQITAGLLSTTSIAPVSDSNYNCNSSNSNICEQLWQVELTPTNGQCVLNGTLMLNFTVDCQTSYSGSCSSLAVPYYGTTVDISSFNVCPELIQQVDVTGNLTSYQDSNYQIAHTSFVYESPAYFKAIVDGPSILITKSTLEVLMCSSLNGIQMAINFGLH